MTVELKIKEVREEAGISLRKLEEETGIDRHYLSDIENKKIDVDEILFIEMLVIANALGKTILDLYDVGTIEITKLEIF